MSAVSDTFALFFPINPAKAELSWKRLHDEALDRFFAGTYAGDYEAALVKEFDADWPMSRENHCRVASGRHLDNVAMGERKGEGTAHPHQA